jgi:hypothetical protein
VLSQSPFEWSPATLERGLNFTLTTTIGDIEDASSSS